VKFYYFGGVFETDHSDSLETPYLLEKHNFDGVMFTYDATQGDMFTRTARDIRPAENIKYLVAIRPYTISPQYLQTIHDSINEIDDGRLQVNFIAGYIKDHESHIEGIVGDIVDSSDSISKSNYMINFIKTINDMKINKKPLDFYISTTNSYVFDEAKKHNNKIILPYHIWKRGFWSDVYKSSSGRGKVLDVDGVEIMMSVTPIIRETEEELKSLTNYALRPIWKKGEVSKVLDDVEYFTYESFHEFVKMVEENGVHYLLINAVPRVESTVIIPFIKKYVESQKEFVSNITNKETNILGGKNE
jgi:hypothetical protein